MARTLPARPRARLLRRLAAACAVATATALTLLGPAPAALAASDPASAGSSTPGATPSPSGSYTPAGTPIKGGTDAAGSAALTQPGQYVDTLDKGSASTSDDGTVKYYSIVLHKGDKAFLTTTLVPPSTYTTDGSISLDVEITSVDESLCYFEDSNYESEQGNVLSPLSVVLATGQVGGPDWDDSCPSNGTFIVKVVRSGNAHENDAMPVEIGYHLEPALVSSGVPGIAATGSDVPISAGTDQLRKVDAGHSYDDAPVLTSGRYQDTISSGQTRYVRIPLDWGQRLGFFVASSQVSGNGGDGVSAVASLYNPIRTPLTLADGVDDDFESGFGGSDAQLSGTTKVLLRYANRESTNDGIAPYSIAGDYYFALTLGYADDGASLSVPYTMQLTVIGAPEAAPSYSYSPVAASSSGSDGGGSGALVWVLVAVVVVAVLVVGLVVLRRRSPAHAGATPTPRAGPTRGGRNGPGGHSGRGGRAARSGLGSAPTTGIPTRAPGPRPSQPPFPAPGPAPSGQRPSQPQPQRPPAPPPQGQPPQGPPPSRPPGPPAR